MGYDERRKSAYTCTLQKTASAFKCPSPSLSKKTRIISARRLHGALKISFRR